MEKAGAEVRHVFNRRGSSNEIENKAMCELYGLEIPKKSRVIINAWAINKDPNTWDDPETGRRICPGISFGLANLELLLASLLYYFDWKLADGIDSEDLDMTEVFVVTVERKNDS
ncbi:cytochrome P450 71D9-like protein [Tanacetum coccineum]